MCLLSLRYFLYCDLTSVFIANSCLRLDLDRSDLFARLMKSSSSETGLTLSETGNMIEHEKPPWGREINGCMYSMYVLSHMALVYVYTYCQSTNNSHYQITPYTRH